MKIIKLIVCVVGIFCCGKVAAEDITSVRDTLITNDSIIVVHTVCAPICSSRARIYNNEGKRGKLLDYKKFQKK